MKIYATLWGRERAQLCGQTMHSNEQTVDIADGKQADNDRRRICRVSPALAFASRPVTETVSLAFPSLRARLLTRSLQFVLFGPRLMRPNGHCRLLEAGKHSSGFAKALTDQCPLDAEYCALSLTSISAGHSQPLATQILIYLTRLQPIHRGNQWPSCRHTY